MGTEMVCPKDKIPYASIEAARVACGSIARMAKKAGQKKVKIRAYICPECGKWHVGRGARGPDADWSKRKIWRT
jgi:hypothetical protein